MASEPDIYVLRTQLTLSQTVDALQSSMDYSDLRFRFGINCKGHRRFIGNVEGDHFRIMRRPRFFSDSAGIFDGTIFEETYATRLDGTFVNPDVTLNLDRRVQNAYPQGHEIAILVMIVIALFITYSLIRSIFDSDFVFLNEDTVLAVFVLLVNLLFLPLVLRNRKQSQRHIVDHLKTVLHATESN